MAWPVVASLAPTTAASATDGWLDQRRLDLGGRDPVAGHVHDVVDPAEQPEVAVVVELGAVAGEVPARRTGSSRSPRSARGRRRCPRSIAGQGRVRVRYPPPLVTGAPASSTISAPMPGRGNVAEPGLRVGRAGQRG